MVFAHDVEGALVAAADLVNTAARGEELLPDLDAVQEFHTRHDYAPSAMDDVTLQDMHRIRQRLRSLWELTKLDDIVAFVNQALEESAARPKLVQHDHWGWHVHYTPLGAPLDRMVLAETAMALVSLFQHEELTRLKTCAAEDCDAVMVDLSRNRSRRYCDVGNCGNRANVAAYRARQREDDQQE